MGQQVSVIASDAIWRTVYNQAIIETDNFRSRRYVEDNNLFGMKKNSRKLYTGLSGDFCIYSNVESSVLDYIMRQKQFGISFNSPPERFIIDTLNSGYVAGRNLESGNREVLAYLKLWNQLSGIKSYKADPTAARKIIEYAGLALAIVLLTLRKK